ncbi:MAG: hypothetical protein IPN90_00495 [Elusimicrobia bacterium]|nr:hypothetical protein [Elusimicrobiota bacterium]
MNDQYLGNDFHKIGKMPPSLSALLIGDGGTASGVGQRETSSSSNSGRTYSPTPIETRSLAEFGDVLERLSSAELKVLFPEYEALWMALIWDVTDRDFLPCEGQPRPDCPEKLREFAEAHYTFFRSLMMARALLSTKQLINGHPLEPYYSNERFIFFYSQLGRIRDMVCLMLERFGQASGQLAAGPSLRHQSREFDSGKIKIFLKDQVTEQCSNVFDNWWDEVKSYRNLLHQVANAVRIDRGSFHILKPDLVKGREGGWVKTLDRSRSDFVEVEEVMKKHFDAINKWGNPIWIYFETTVNSWRKDNTFAGRLNLPSS